MQNMLQQVNWNLFLILAKTRKRNLDEKTQDCSLYETKFVSYRLRTLYQGHNSQRTISTGIPL